MHLLDNLKKNKILAPIIERITSSDIGSRMAKGAFWSLTGTAIAKAVVLGAGILCARILGKVEYGEFGMVRSTVNMMVVFGSMGLGVTASKYIAEFRTTDKDRVGSIHALTGLFAAVSGLMMTVVVIIAAPFLAARMLDAPYLTNDIRLGGLLLFVTILNSAQSGVLSGLENFRSIAINTLIASIAEALFMLVGAYYFGVSGAIVGFGTGFAVLYLGNVLSIRKDMRKLGVKKSMRRINMEDIKIIYKFSIPSALSWIMMAPVFWYMRSMLARGSGFGEVAIFEIADQWKLMILFIPSALAQIIMPILSNLYSKGNDIRTYNKALKYNIVLNAIVTLVLALLVSAFSGFILKLYGNDFGSVWTLVILAFSTVFSSIATVVKTAINSKGHAWTGFGFGLFWAIIALGFSRFFLSLELGATGIALAVLCSYAIYAAVQGVYLVWSGKNELRPEPSARR